MASGSTAKDKADNAARASRRTRRPKTRSGGGSQNARSRSHRTDERKVPRAKSASAVKARRPARRGGGAGASSGETRNQRTRAANLAAQRDAR